MQSKCQNSLKQTVTLKFRIINESISYVAVTFSVNRVKNSKFLSFPIRLSYILSGECLICKLSNDALPSVDCRTHIDDDGNRTWRIITVMTIAMQVLAKKGNIIACCK